MSVKICFRTRLLTHRQPSSFLPEYELIFYSIALGDVNGQLQQAFAKLTTLHTKNNFTIAIVTGNLFSDGNEAVSDLLAGKITVPLPTYFTIGTTPLPEQIVEKIKHDKEVNPLYWRIAWQNFSNSISRSAQIFIFLESTAQPKHPRISKSSY